MSRRHDFIRNLTGKGMEYIAFYAVIEDDKYTDYLILYVNGLLLGNLLENK